ncbi:CPBP family intramembrane glutamic endopeptidase [Stagnihabitans tardus]|uniref:CPBP family intramembrane metalloprotease n=1 Tax=Stagnihabitans tardus TaxID=2699202 RepID=A0AAE4YEW4_9RHOB|nr:CPBP family intramembrane glutamic endopeptidase [Stagnihabitans tardus]NBZ88425.1 CPBP family intramembrane metalloprotease [Stagnihabitans tardus]
MSDTPDPMPHHGAAYAPLTGFAAPARGRAELWRILAVFALLVLLGDVAQALMSQVVRGLMGPLFGPVALLNLSLGLTPFGVVGNLLMTLPVMGVFVLAVALVTGRGPVSLLGATARLKGDFLAGFLPLCALGLGLLPLLAQGPAVATGRDLGQVLAWLPLALPALVVMALANEVIYRGFLQQQLAARWQPSWVWMGLPAALFALSQGAPSATGELAPLSLVWALAYGMAAADLTARTGSLGAAIGLQSALLAQSLLLIGLKGPMNGLALYTLDARGMALLPWMASDFLTLLVGWLSARLLLRV